MVLTSNKTTMKKAKKNRSQKSTIPTKISNDITHPYSYPISPSLSLTPYNNFNHNKIQPYNSPP